MILKKKDKSPRIPWSYRPISLINADGKVYSKMLATRLAQVIPSLVSRHQHVFVPGRSTVNHLHRIIASQDYAITLQKQIGIIFLDVEKAFDRVSWSFLWATMRKMGFGPQFLVAFQTMYKRPRAKICTLRKESSFVYITRGNRQGCLCSPLLFAIYINPLWLILETTNGIQSMVVGQH